MAMDDVPVRVAIVAPAPSMRLGLAAMLADFPGIEISVNVASLDEAYPAFLAVDVLLLAGRGVNPADLRDSHAGWDIPVLLLAEIAPERAVVPEDLPIWGALATDTPPERLAQAILALHAGLFVYEPAWVSRLAGAPPVLQNGLDAEIEPLSPREREVLELLALGLANKQISVRLSLSENTIKYHISSIYAKLGASNRAEAVRLGARRGYISV